jgi:hypothetical protein
MDGKAGKQEKSTVDLRTGTIKMCQPRGGIHTVEGEGRLCDRRKRG